MTDENISSFILEKLKRLETKIGALRDETNIQGLLRIDGTLRGLLNEQPPSTLE